MQQCKQSVCHDVLQVTQLRVNLPHRGAHVINSPRQPRYGLQDINSSLHQQISYEAALQSFVLLKNDGPVLPIRQGSSVAVVGPHSMSRSQLFSDSAAGSHCFDGTDACVPTITEGLSMANAGGRTVSSMGVEINSTKDDGIPAALDAARKADVVVLALGDDRTIETEGKDRIDTALPGLQESFAHKVLALKKPTILVLVSGGPMAIDSLMSRTVAPYAIVQAFFPSHKGSEALGATFFGKENRWGKLPVTMYPHQYISEQPMTNYDMSKAPGRTYKYYQGQPLFSFGYGLSLTTFKLQCAQKKAPNGKLAFECKVSNMGKLCGDEVIQAYHTTVDIGKVDHPLPKRALRDFQRLHVPAGEAATVSFDLPTSILEVVNKACCEDLFARVASRRGAGSSCIMIVRFFHAENLESLGSRGWRAKAVPGKARSHLLSRRGLFDAVCSRGTWGTFSFSAQRMGSGSLFSS